VRYAFIAAQDGGYDKKLLCRMLKVSRSGYYAWQRHPESARAKENERLLMRIREVHAKSRSTYGSPRVWRQLRRDGETCGRGRVARLMREAGIAARQKRRFKVTTDSAHNLPVAANLVDRRFNVGVPNRIWASDITYIPTSEGWLYLSAVMDLYSRQIVGWAMKETLGSAIAVDALKMAHERRRPEGEVIHHSDRGCQYASDEYRRLLEHYGMHASMSGTGNCFDNAVVESFFATLKTELVHQKRYSSRDEAISDIFEYIEVFYNRQRLHSSLGYMTPVQFEAAAAV